MTPLNPATEDELVDAIRSANDADTPLEIIAGGSKRRLGRPPAGQQLSLSAFSGITCYEPEEMVITAKAATPLNEIVAALHARGQCLAFEPPSTALWSSGTEQATIGGTVSAAVSGARRFAAGSARDHLLGFRAVNGKGELFKGGGKVVKNVTGYDLPKLAAGSFGTLFVMTEVTLRAIPAARATTGVLVEGLGLSEALSCLRRLSMSPLEPTGLSFLPQAVARHALGLDHSLTLIRFEGDKAGASARASDAVPLVDAKAKLMDDQTTIRLFSQVTDVTAFLDTSAEIWRVCVPPTAAEKTISALNPDKYFVDWAGGVLWLQRQQHGKPANIHAVAAANGGHAMLTRGSRETPDDCEVFQPMDQATAMITSRLKHAFDPGRILNLGRMYKDI